MIKINFRPLFIGFISLIISIVIFTYLRLKFNALSIAIATIYLIFVLIALIFLCLSFIKHNNKFFELIKKLRKNFIVISVFSLIALIGVNVVVNNYSKNEEYFDATVEAKIYDVKQYNNYCVLTLDNIKLEDKNLNGLLELGFTFGDNANLTNFKEGNRIKFVATINSVKLNYDNIKSATYGVKYSAITKFNSIEINNGKTSFKTLIKNGVLNNLNSILNEENSDLAFYMLFGEKDNLSEEIYNVFSYSGLFHILAVSGLHVGFLVALLVFLLNKTKCNKNLRNIIVFVILLFYAYLCNFTPSVVRASIMSMVFLIATSSGLQYDALSSLSLAGIIILIVNPMNLFLIGFQLSFASVFAIITLSKGITKLLTDIKCPKVLANSLAISISVNLGVLAISGVHFKNLNLISVFSNILVIPMFSICFIMLFIFSFLSLLIPFIKYLLVLPNLFLHFIKLIANFFANINFLNFEVFVVGYILVALNIIILYIFKFVITKFKFKTIICTCLVVISILILVLTNLPIKYKSNNLFVNYSRYGNCAIVTNENNNKILIVNNLLDTNKIKSNLDNFKIKNVDAVIFYNFNVSNTDCLKDIIIKYNINKLYIEDNFKSHIISNFSKITNITFVDENLSLFGYTFNYYKNLNSTIALELININNKVLFFADNIAKNDLVQFYNCNYDLIVSNNNNFNFSNLNIFASTYLTYRETKQKENCINLQPMVYFTKTFK